MVIYQPDVCYLYGRREIVVREPRRRVVDVRQFDVHADGCSQRRVTFVDGRYDQSVSRDLDGKNEFNEDNN